MKHDDAQTDVGEAMARARVKRPERLQMRWRDTALDQLIPADHRVRLVWA